MHPQGVQHTAPTMSKAFEALSINQASLSLPPIREMLQMMGESDVSRRSSTASLASSEASSGSSLTDNVHMEHTSPASFSLGAGAANLPTARRTQLQIDNQVGHTSRYSPYPTPVSTPVLATVDSPARRPTKRPRAIRGVAPHKQENSITALKPPKGDRGPKAIREAGARFQETAYIARLQNALIRANPNIAHFATPRPGKTGWKDLKQNNIMDVLAQVGVDPLTYNKKDVLGTGSIVIDQDTALLGQLVALLEAIGQTVVAKEVAKAVALRGCVGFRLPEFQPRSRL